MSKSLLSLPSSKFLVFVSFLLHLSLISHCLFLLSLLTVYLFARSRTLPHCLAHTHFIPLPRRPPGQTLQTPGLLPQLLQFGRAKREPARRRSEYWWRYKWRRSWWCHILSIFSIFFISFGVGQRVQPSGGACICGWQSLCCIKLVHFSSRRFSLHSTVLLSQPLLVLYSP